LGNCRNDVEAGFSAMRLRRLILDRYGHLADIEISFLDKPDFHIIVGPNEAGKSTALSAIGDALFRFPHKTNYDFLHGTRGLRVGIDVQSRDGRQAVFFRRKGRKDDLYDNDDQPVSEAAIAAFLGGATRERFDTVFGLNGVELRGGGKAILEGKGDAGSAIMSAYAGVHDYRRIVQKLEEAAGRLYGDRRGQRQFHVAIERYHASRQELNEKRVDPDAWKTAAAERDRLNQLLSDNATRATTLHAERSRLDRTRRTTPFCRRILTLIDERESLGPVPDLPEDAQTRFSDALASRTETERDLEREGDNLKSVASALDTLPPDDVVLAQAEAIDALVGDRKRIAEAMKDRETQRTIASHNEALIRDEGSQLGLSLDADGLISKRPSDLDRERVAQAISDYDRLEERRVSAEIRLAEAVAAESEAKLNFEAITPVNPTTALQEAIDRAKAEGRLDAELAEATRTLDSARAERDRSFSELPLWERDIAALSALCVPLTSELDRISGLLNQHRQSLQECDVRLSDYDREIDALDAETMADAVTGDLPTEDAILASRQVRDMAWTLIRREFLEEGPLISEAERKDVNLGHDTAGGFEALIRAADGLSDRRTKEQERVVAAEQRRRRRVERNELRSQEVARRKKINDSFEGAELEWRSLWEPAGIKPADPHAMKEWLGLRHVILGHHAAEESATRKCNELRSRYAVAMADLVATLPPESPPLQTLASQLRHAESVSKALNAQAAAKEAARKDLERAESEHVKAAKGISKVDTEMAAWQRDWAAVTALLSLPPSTPPGLGRIALQHWNRIDDARKDRQAALARVYDMTMAINGFVASTESLVSLAAPDLTGQPAMDAAKILAERLSEARRVKQGREQLVKQQQKIETAITKYADLNKKALTALVSLEQLAKADDEEGLRLALSRWTRLRAIAAEIAREQAELHGLDDGMTIAQLMAEAADVDFDEIPARISDIEGELAAIETDNRANIERRLVIRDKLAEMERGRDAAASAQAMETALADIDDVVLRYPPIRMAHILLRAGIERFQCFVRRFDQRSLHAPGSR
jgi:uncharacterized protein YhaN